METIKFKTTINCGTCVAKVKPVLDSQDDVSQWEVDTENPDKILIVHGENIDEADLVKVLQKVGYKAERI